MTTPKSILAWTVPGQQAPDKASVPPQYSLLAQWMPSCLHKKRQNWEEAEKNFQKTGFAPGVVVPTHSLPASGLAEGNQAAGAGHTHRRAAAQEGPQQEERSQH